MFKNEHLFYMYGKIKFNREILDEDMIGVEGLEFTINGKKINFEFMTISMEICDDVLEFEAFELNPTGVCYADDMSVLNQNEIDNYLLSAKYLSVTSFDEFGISTANEDLEVECIQELYICNKNGEFKIPKNILLEAEENVKYYEVA